MNAKPINYHHWNSQRNKVSYKENRIVCSETLKSPSLVTLKGPEFITRTKRAFLLLPQLNLTEKENKANYRVQQLKKHRHRSAQKLPRLLKPNEG